MIWSKLRFQHSLELFPRVLKEVAPLLLPLSLVLWGFEFCVGELNKARFEDPYNVSMIPIIVVTFIGVFYQGFVSVVWTLYVARSSQRQMKNAHGPHPLIFLKTHFYQALIEYIRAMVSIGFYFLAFFIPGLFRWVQLIFICLVASFDKDYLEGKKDALRESGRLVRGQFTALFFLVVLQNFLPFMIEMGAKFSSLSWLFIIFIHLISWILSLYFSIYFSLTFFALASFKMEKA